MRSRKTIGVRQAAKKLGYSLKYVYDLVYMRRLSARKVGRTWRVSTQSGSVRTLYFGEGLTQALTEHSQKAARKSPEDFVFCKPDGGPLHPDVLRKDVLYPALDRLGILRSSGASGFHTFRHSAASFINAQTGNLKLAQKLLGHSTSDITAMVYTHTSAEAEREAALAVERAILRRFVPQSVPN
jgi:excisionase family DNA binding protein